MRSLKAILVAFALAACATAPATLPSVSSETAAALDAANAAFSAAYMRGDVEAILAAYTPDAVVQTPEGVVSTSPESLRAMWSPVAQSGPRATHQLFATYRQALEGGAILETGRYEISSRTSEGEQRWRRGCYTLVWRRGSAGWLIHYDTWTSPRDPATTCEAR